MPNDFTRRHLLSVGGSAIAMFAVGPVARAQGFASEELVGVFPPLPPDFGPDDTPDPFVPYGTALPLEEEVRLAELIISRSPCGADGARPIDVAGYFNRVGQGVEPQVSDLGEVRHYVRPWPVRYNPVIVNFFRATGLDALGQQADGTAWCAAFVNWCIARSLSNEREVRLNPAGIMPLFNSSVLLGTGSASSGSFRCWHSESTASPREGDVVVWALEGTERSCPANGSLIFGQGHVAFFFEQDADGRFLTIGGNQRDPVSNQSAAVAKWIPRSFPRSGGALAHFHSIRSTF